MLGSDSVHQDEYDQPEKRDADDAAGSIAPVAALRLTGNDAHQKQHEDYQQYCSKLIFRLYKML